MTNALCHKKFLYAFAFLSFFATCLNPLIGVGATFEVDTLTDTHDAVLDGVCKTKDDECSLRAAIQEANFLAEESVINFSVSGTFKINFISSPEGGSDFIDGVGDLDVLAPITINGLGVEDTVLDIENVGYRFFHLRNGTAALTLKDMSLNRGGGSQKYGGVIFNYGGTVTLQNVNINQAMVQNDGGAIYSHEGTVTLENVNIDGCSSAKKGSAIFNEDGTVVIANSSITNNSGTDGAIRSDGGSLDIQNTVLSGNESSNTAGALSVKDTTVILDTVTMRENSASISTGAFAANSSIVTMTNTSIENNSAPAFPGVASIASTWKITNSTFSGHNALIIPSSMKTPPESECEDGVDNDGDGLTDQLDTDCWAGIGAALGELFSLSHTFGASTYTIENSTFTGNSAARYGGAIAIASNATMTLSNVTIAQNNSNDIAGGIFVESGGSVSLRNTLIAHNTASSGVAVDCSGALSSLGYNLVTDTHGCDFSALTTDLVGNSSTGSSLDALLGDFANHGGATHTVSLQASSPAVDAGDPSGCVDDLGNLFLVDQRSELRSSDGNNDGLSVCDIGAYEYQYAVPDAPDVHPENPDDPEVGLDDLTDPGTHQTGDSGSDTNADEPDAQEVAIPSTNYQLSGGPFSCQLQHTYTHGQNHTSPFALVFLAAIVVLVALGRVGAKRKSVVGREE